MSFLSGLPAPILAPLGINTAPKVNDVLVKDKHQHISQVLADAGFTGQDIKIGTAVALAESGGDTRVTHKNHDGSTDVGLMQDNSVHAGEAGSPRDLAGFIKWAQDPHNNAVLAHSIWAAAGGSWAPWVTYTTGAYKKHLGQDKLITTKGTASGAISGAVDAALSPLDALGSIAAALFDPSTYLRVGKGALGGAFLVLGTGALVFIIANKAAATPVGKTATKAAAAAATL
jgi:hypothetical protein